MREKNVHRDDPLLLPPDDVLRDEFDEHEEEYKSWRRTIYPGFEARMLSVAAGLLGGLGREIVREFYEDTFYEAFSRLQESQTSSAVGARGVQSDDSGEPR